MNTEQTEFFRDVLEMGINGGINYWAEITELSTDEIFVEDALDEDDDKSYLIDLDELMRATIKINYGVVALASDLRGTIAFATHELDAGEIDAVLADIIIQVAAFGEVMYS